jgi:HD-like signal output (HDOD) protein
MFNPRRRAGGEWSYAEPVEASSPSLHWSRGFGVDARFFPWVVNGQAHNPYADPVAENMVLFGLKRVTESSLSSTNLVPRMPHVLPELMLSLHDKNISNARIASHIGRDPSLVAEVIREANSCYYRKADRVLTVNKAIMVLGDVGLRAVVAKASIRPVISQQPGRIAHHSAVRVWMQSERCAMGSSYLATAYRANPYEAFLAGLIKNLGVIVALRLIDVIYKGRVVPATPAFCETVMMYATQFSIWAAKSWRLPESIVFALEELNRAHQSETITTMLGYALVKGDLLSKTVLLVEAGEMEAADLRDAELSQTEMTCWQKMSKKNP